MAAQADPREFSKVVDCDHAFNFQLSGGSAAVKEVDSAKGTAFGWDYAKDEHTSWSSDVKAKTRLPEASHDAAPSSSQLAGLAAQRGRRRDCSS